VCDIQVLANLDVMIAVERLIDSTIKCPLAVTVTLTLPARRIAPRPAAGRPGSMMRLGVVKLPVGHGHR
jgi:hypothetical protein